MSARTTTSGSAAMATVGKTAYSRCFLTEIDNHINPLERVVVSDPDFPACAALGIVRVYASLTRMRTCWTYPCCGVEPA